MTDPYDARLNFHRELIVCEGCEGMFYGDPRHPVCNSCIVDMCGEAKSLMKEYAEKHPEVWDEEE